MERQSIKRLREEILQNKPFLNHSHAAALALLRTADEVRRRVELLVTPLGISPEQYNVLRILRGAGEGGLPTLDIAARMLERNPGITRLLDKLEAKRLVLRTRCDKDRRRVFCTITAAGAALLNRMDEPAHLQNLDLFRGLTGPQIDTLIDLLDRVRHPDQAQHKEKES